MLKRNHKSRILSSSRYPILGLLLVLFLYSFLLYAPGYTNEFAFDDKALIQDNSFFTADNLPLQKISTTNYRFGSGNTEDGLYRPLVMLSYLLNGSSPQPDPMPFHMTNSILHALCSVFFFLLLLQLTNKLLISFVAGIVFASHPLHTEAVSNIAGRPELLYTFFLFSSWLVLERVHRVSVQIPLVALLYFAALLSKETAVVFPCIILCLDILNARKLHMKDIISRFIIPISVLLLYLGIRWHVLGNTATGNEPLFYNNPIAYEPHAHRIATAFSILLQYLKLFLMPIHLSSDYSYNVLKLYNSPLNPLPLFAILLSFISVVTASILRKKRPELALSLCLFIFPYLIISNILFPIGTIMGERLMYLPLAGFALLTGKLFNVLYNKNRSMALLAISALIITYSAGTIQRTREWHDNFRLTLSDVQKSPHSVKLLYNAGVEYAARKQYSIAEEYYQRAIDIYPKFSEAYSGLGKLMYDRKMYEESVYFYNKSLEYDQNTPEILFDLAAVYITMKNFEEATGLLSNGIDRFPQNSLLYRGMGNILLAEEKYPEALKYYQSAYNLGGVKNILLNNMALSCYLSGNYTAANRYVDIAQLQGILLHPQMVQSIRSMAGSD